MRGWLLGHPCRCKRENAASRGPLVPVTVTVWPNGTVDKAHIIPKLGLGARARSQSPAMQRAGTLRYMGPPRPGPLLNRPRRDKCSKQGKPSQANRSPKNLGRSHPPPIAEARMRTYDDPRQQCLRHELGPVVAAQKPRGAACAHQV